MDPNATWQTLVCLIEGLGPDSREANVAASNLYGWLMRDGFPPNITGKPKVDRCIAIAVCLRVLE
jgi:hypothetical protein